MTWLAKPIGWVLVLVVPAAALIHGTSFAGAPDTTLRVLFVGNSYTYYNSLPQLVEAMAEKAFPGQGVESKFVGAGGATLKEHWDEGFALEEIRTGRWDYVVLQEQSMLGSAVTEDGQLYFSGPDLFFGYAKRFDHAIRESGAKTLFLMTWSRRGHKEQQKYLTYAYMTIAGELGSEIAPVGLVWDLVRHDRDIDLYDRDGSHPSIYGSFLAATTIVSVLFDSHPTNIPGHLTGYEILRNGRMAMETSVLADLSDADVKTIVDATAAVFERLKRNGGYLEVEEAIRERDPPPPWKMLLRWLGRAEGQATALLVGALIFFGIKGCRRWVAQS